MTSLCENAIEIIKELQRSEWLSTFNDDRVRAIIDEINIFHAQILEKMRVYGDDIERHASLHCGLVVTHQCLLRNKRCLLCYIMMRVYKIKRLRWEVGAIIPPFMAENLSSSEIEFFHAYDQLVTEYMISVDLDLTNDMSPPKDLYIQVRVLVDSGELMTESGAVYLQANSTHFLRRIDVEPLIRENFLQQI